jgi:DNA repair exonuclease SbcCD ATPase subunit/DNA repair exonuclease SbcCD nuclease subunit
MRYLATADVHVESWSRYEVFPGFRLSQYSKLADWWKDIIDEYGVDAVLISGDYFHKPVNQPKVLLAGVELIKKVSEKAPVFITHGQHDLDTREKTGNFFSNSLVSLINEVGGERVIYLHNKSYLFKGEKLFGYGWEPNFEPDMEEARGARVVLLHGQVKGTKAKGKHVFEDGFDPEDLLYRFPEAYMVIGDIHKHQVVKDRIIIPGPPIYHTFSDGSAGVVVLDTISGQIEYLPQGYVRNKKVYTFLSLVSEGSGNTFAEEVDPDSLVVKRKMEKTQDRGEVIANRHSPMEVLKEVADREGLLDTLMAVYQRRTGYEDSPYDHPQFWTPISMEVHNFRSIKEAKFDFEDMGKLVFVSGLNGSGKSSFLLALKFALTGEGDKSLIRAGEKETKVLLSLSYMGKEVEIERGFSPSQYLRVTIDGEPLEAPSLREKQARLEEALPFVKTFDSIAYFDQFRPGILSHLTPSQRVELVSEIFGLSIISDLQEQAKDMANTLKSEINSLNSSFEEYTRTLKSFKSVEEELRLAQVSPEDEEVYENLSSAYQDLQERIREYEKEEREILANIRETSRSISDIERKIQESSRTGRCYACGTLLGGEKLSLVISSLEEERQKLVQRNEQYQVQLESLRKATEKLRGNLQKISQRYQELHEAISRRSHLQSYYERLFATIVEVERKMEEISSQLNSKIKEHENLVRLSKLLSGKGYAEVLRSVSESLSSPGLRVETYHEHKNGSVKPTVELYFQSRSGSDLPFDLLSGGQKTLADLKFLFKLVSYLDGVGVMVFDETFRFLDSKSYEEVFEIMSSIRASHIFYISHDMAPALRFDTQISVIQDDEGVSHYFVDQ